MREKIVVIVNNSDVLPQGTHFEVDSWQIRDEGERVYFKEKTEISGTIIPSDTVFVLDVPYRKEQGRKEVTARAIRGTWRMNYGIHKGTLMTRDSANAEGFESLEALKKVYARYKAFHESIRYVCWFAYAYPPAGSDVDKVQIDTSVPYR